MVNDHVFILQKYSYEIAINQKCEQASTDK